MATKIKRVVKTGPAVGSQPAADDLDVLHPDRHLVFGNLHITVREYRHVEWLLLLPMAAPLVDAISRLIDARRQPTYEEALSIVATHIEDLAPLIAQSADIDAATFERLAPDEGELLLMTWWGVNGRFFVQRALNRVAVMRAEAKATAPAAP